jgi:hypothetical protein
MYPWLDTLAWPKYAPTWTGAVKVRDPPSQDTLTIRLDGRRQGQRRAVRLGVGHGQQQLGGVQLRDARLRVEPGQGERPAIPKAH